MVLYLILVKRFKIIADKLFGSQFKITVIYVVIMIVPNLFLAYTEPYRLTTVLASLLIPASLYLLWAIMRDKPGSMILWSLPFMILGAFQLVLLYMFGGSIIAIDMFTNLLTTSVGEASEVLGNISVSIIGVCVLYVPLLILGVYSLRMKDRLSKPLRKKMAIVAVAMLVAGAGFAGVSKLMNPKFAIRYHVFPINVLNNIVICFERWDRVTDYLETSRDFTFSPVREDSVSGKEVYVLVVGEASRASSWRMFGAERETTPRLDTTKNIVPMFDVITQSNTTHKSVPIILSAVSAANFDDLYSQKSIITLFKEAGFNTMFISNQGPNRSFIDHFGQEADSTVLLHSLPGSSANHYDSDVLPFIADAVKRNTGKLFIVMHSYGSHFDFSKRYPPEFSKYQPDAITSIDPSYGHIVRNAYDNSVLFTDYVLSEIIGLLKADTVSCSAMFYCADHGDDTMDDSRARFLHASPTTTYYQLHVASFGWFSDGYVGRFPAKFEAAQKNSRLSASTANVFHTVVDIASIDSPYEDHTQSLVNPHYREAERTYINDYNEDINIVNSGLTPLDFAMFDKHHLKYDLSAKRNELF